MKIDKQLSNSIVVKLIIAVILIFIAMTVTSNYIINQRQEKCLINS